MPNLDYLKVPAKDWTEENSEVLSFSDRPDDAPWTDLMEDRDLYTFAKEKASYDAALRVVQFMMDKYPVSNRRKIHAIAEKYPDAIIVPIHSSGSKNRLPKAFADYLGEKTGLKVDESIIQTNHRGASRQDDFYRLAHRAYFAGKVIPGMRYILADDVFSRGGSYSDAMHFIEAYGGTVCCLAALGHTEHGTRIALLDDTRNNLTGAFGEKNLSAFTEEIILYGGNFKRYTEREGKYILRELDYFNKKKFNILTKEGIPYDRDQGHDHHDGEGDDRHFLQLPRGDVRLEPSGRGKLFLDRFRDRIIAERAKGSGRVFQEGLRGPRESDLASPSESEQPISEKEQIYDMAQEQLRAVSAAIAAGTHPCLPDSEGSTDTRPAVNILSGKAYSGASLLFLKDHALRNGFPTAEYIPEESLEAAGVRPKQGQQPVSISHGKPNEPPVRNVYNIAQLEGAEKIPARQPGRSDGPPVPCSGTEPVRYLAGYFAACALGRAYSVSAPQADRFRENFRSSVSGKNAMALSVLCNEAWKQSAALIQNIRQPPRESPRGPDLSRTRKND